MLELHKHPAPPGTDKAQYTERTVHQRQPQEKSGFNGPKCSDRPMHRRVGTANRRKEEKSSRAHNRYDGELIAELLGKSHLTCPQIGVFIGGTQGIRSNSPPIGWLPLPSFSKVFV